MNRSLHLVLIPVVLLVLVGVPAFAQSVISAQSGLIHYIQGRVYLGDQAVETKFGQFPQIKENEELRTARGRAEVLLNPGVFLRVKENSSFRMISTRLTDPRLELLSGTILIEAAELDKDTPVTVVYRDATISLLQDGLYRLETEPAQVRVFDGRAVVTVAGQEVIVKKGRLLALDGTLAVQKFDRDQTDAFDRWSGRRAEQLAMANIYAARSINDMGLSWRSSAWGWNPYFGMFTFIPLGGAYYSPYGYRFWSPTRVYVLYEPPRRASSLGGGGWSDSSRGYYDSNRGYTVVRETSSGTSGTMARGASAPTTSSSSSSAPIQRSTGQAGGSRR